MKIYCSGIDGIGLSAYAAYQHAAGHEVLGSDRKDSTIVSDLRSQGIAVSLNQDGSILPEDCDLFVYTLALPPDHPELCKAKEMGIPCRTYFEALGDLTKDFTVIAVAGTSGKSSTTAMAATVLIDLGLDPSVILGTKTLSLDNRNWRKGESNVFLVEACEYCGSFLHLCSSISLITNLYGDHFDEYGDMQSYMKAFEDFINHMKDNGVLITHMQDPQCTALCDAWSQKRGTIIDADDIATPELSVPGEHMQRNGQLVLGLARFLGLDEERVRTSLRSYTGSWRRSEIRGTTAQGALVIDDYAHHPIEIQTTLSGLRHRYGQHRLIVVFQPHTHDRTRRLYAEFLTAFTSADLVIIPNIFAARSDSDENVVDVQQFVEDIRTGSATDVRCINSLEGTAKELLQVTGKNDLIVTMGAGDVWKVADMLTL